MPDYRPEAWQVVKTPDGIEYSVRFSGTGNLISAYASWHHWGQWGDIEGYFEKNGFKILDILPNTGFCEYKLEKVQ